MTDQDLVICIWYKYMLIVFYLVESLSVLQTAKVISRPLRSYRDTDCVLWYFDHLQCCNTGMSCCSHRTCHLICHSTQTLRPVSVLSMNVRYQTGTTTLNYPFRCLWFDQTEKSLPQSSSNEANGLLAFQE